ncbi:peptidylprolyl isomerase [Sulfurospirillum sp. 1307]
MKKIILIFFLFFSTFLFSATPNVVFETSKGKMVFEMYPQIAPKAVENFTKLVESGYYDGIIFHRVIKNFMIQGGDPSGTGMGGKSIWGKPFEDEFKPNVVFNRNGLLAMANRGRNTNGSQFFITTVPTPWLKGRHTIFGELIEGYDVLEKIENVEVDSRKKPLEDIKIIKAYLLK